MEGESVSWIPMDIITLILCLLPVKSLLCFRCVSKSWLSLIDSPDFIKFHLEHSAATGSNQNLIIQSNCFPIFNCHFLKRGSRFFLIDLDTLKHQKKFQKTLSNMIYRDSWRLVSCCNGIVAMVNNEKDIVLWNPSTAKYRKLKPNPEFYKKNTSDGFGYDSVSDDYKFVRVVRYGERYVYRLNSDSWHTVYHGVDYDYSSRGVFFSNAYHWFPSHRWFRDNSYEELIGTFDFETETFNEFSQPRHKEAINCLNLSVLGGCLCVSTYSHHRSSTSIWVMKRYGEIESWTEVCAISSWETFWPIVYSKGEDKRILLYSCHSFAWYDVRKKLLNRVKKFISSKKNQMLHHGAEICVGSLVDFKGKSVTEFENEQNAKKRRG